MDLWNTSIDVLIDANQLIINALTMADFAHRCMSEMQMEASLLCPQAAVEIAASSVVQRTVWVADSPPS